MVGDRTVTQEVTKRYRTYGRYKRMDNASQSRVSVFSLSEDHIKLLGHRSSIHQLRCWEERERRRSVFPLFGVCIIMIVVC